ncbi:kinase-like domain-containing protein [Geopyxis carbonaria]|nr:kinase-like domain-containing protein [Geopyxis carbonaria]
MYAQWPYSSSDTQGLIAEYTNLRLTTEFKNHEIRHWVDGMEQVWEPWGTRENEDPYFQIQQEKNTQKLRAVKKSLQDVGATTFEEIRIFLTLNKYNEYFVEFYGWYEQTRTLKFAMEYSEFGDLSRNLDQISGHEGSARKIATQLFSGLSIMHRQHIYHGTFSQENILVVSIDPIKIKIIGFDYFISYSTQDVRVPEADSGYHHGRIKDDIWAAGYVIHEIMQGGRPYIDICKKLPEGNCISEAGIAFVKRLLLQSRLEDIPTAEEVLKDRWFDDPTSDHCVRDHMGSYFTELCI